MPATSPGPTSRIFFSQRLRLHYVDWGNADKPPIILLHGGRDHCRNWDWTAAALGQDWHIMAPDLRGHGDSEWSADGSYSIAGYVYDLAQLIHGQGLAPVRIVAHSLGGNIALRYAGLYPEAVSRVVAIEAGRSSGWCKYVNRDALVIGIDRFGASAPYEKIAEELGFTPQKVAQRIREWRK